MYISANGMINLKITPKFTFEFHPDKQQGSLSQNRVHGSQRRQPDRSSKPVLNVRWKSGVKKGYRKVQDVIKTGVE
jgi:hypothetical protein